MPNVTAIVSAVALSLLAVIHVAKTSSMEMGTCRMICDDNSLPPSLPRDLVGAPGKKGPQGIKGEKGSIGPQGVKGEPADSCLCPRPGATEEKVTELRRQIQQINAPEDCYDAIKRKESFRGGVYTIYPYELDERGEEVYCDLETDNGGWIVFQRRMDGSENFFRGWDDYVNGFGDLHGEFWLGLNKIYNITKTGRYEIRIDMADFENGTAYAKYRTFQLGGPDAFFPITTSGYSGTAGNSLQLSGIAFSTKDQDHDTNSAGSCANSYKGAMWYTGCHSTNPNGLYLQGKTDVYARGVTWSGWKGQYYSLKFLEMKMRRIID